MKRPPPHARSGFYPVARCAVLLPPPPPPSPPVTESRGVLLPPPVEVSR